MQYIYSSWYPRYRANAFESVVIDLPENFIEFLHEEGISVCSSSKALPQRVKPADIIVQGVDYDPDDAYSSSTVSDIDSDSASDTHDTNDQQAWHERFPGLHAAMESAIQQLGGQVAPKLNWSSPTDALWLSTFNSLKCSNADQVILLLKGSDRIMHDLEQLQQLQTTQHQLDNKQQQQQQRQKESQPIQVANSDGQSILQQQEQQQGQQLHQQEHHMHPQLVLRRWQDLLPEREFRCFVHQHSLVGISQRDPSQHFPQLGLTGELHSIKAKVMDFHKRSVGNSFPSHAYAMDVYVPASGPVRLLDINPICSTTSPLLFTWEEMPYTQMHTQQTTTTTSSSSQPVIQQDHSQQGDAGSSTAQQQQQQAVDLRVVQHAGMIMPGVRGATGMPYDMLGLQDSFEDMMKFMQQQQQQCQ